MIKEQILVHARMSEEVKSPFTNLKKFAIANSIINVLYNYEKKKILRMEIFENNIRRENDFYLFKIMYIVNIL